MATTRLPLSRDRILQSALELVDEQGLEALTMRRLGQRLGFEAMSLYNYVANKEDVIDGILDSSSPRPTCHARPRTGRSPFAKPRSPYMPPCNAIAGRAAS